MTDSASLQGYALVTGGVGFIGTNLVKRLLEEGREVVAVDDFSRPGVERNARWLTSIGRGRVRIVHQDVTDRGAVETLVRGASQIFHFAAQVAVTTSLSDPLHDFEVNARSTLNVLEAVRKLRRRPPMLFTSTNKVYGALPDLPLARAVSRYEPSDPTTREQGVSERQSLDFCSPYGCSKGAADQYVLDYAKSFELPTVVFRMSCIYGPHQCGNEDQGWVAHFLMRAMASAPITIYGDGLQVRDVLFVEDLVEAMLLARDRAPSFPGQAFNIGGGPRHTTSLIELLARLESLLGRSVEVEFEGTRVGDQRYYVSNIDKFSRATGWVPKTTVAEGLARLHAWLVRAGERAEPARVQPNAQPAYEVR